jgi:hypothetical protein
LRNPGGHAALREVAVGEGDTTMRRILQATVLLTVAALAGCQSTMQAQRYQGYCSARPYDAGFCEQPSNFLLWGFILGER